jgi:hypothetical protein
MTCTSPFWENSRSWTTPLVQARSERLRISCRLEHSNTAPIQWNSYTRRAGFELCAGAQKTSWHYALAGLERGLELSKSQATDLQNLVGWDGSVERWIGGWFVRLRMCAAAPPVRAVESVRRGISWGLSDPQPPHSAFISSGHAGALALARVVPISRPSGKRYQRLAHRALCRREPRKPHLFSRSNDFNPPTSTSSRSFLRA